MKTKLILEIGSNWKTKDDFKRSLDFAKSIGALLKGQLWITDKFVRKSNKNYSTYKRFEVPKEWVRELRCEDMFWTAFDPQSLLFLKTEINPKYYKVSLLDSDQKWMIDSIARTNKECFMSVGIYGLESIRRAVRWYSDAGNIHNLTLMHAVADYKGCDYQLGYMRDRINGSRLIPWGISLNNPSTVLPAVAVGLGCTAVEIHFRLDHIKNTPDAPHSITKAQVMEVVRNIEEVERNVGNNERPLEAELVNIKAGGRGKDGRRK